MDQTNNVSPNTSWQAQSPSFWESLPGNIIIIIGPSGAGKSTLIQKLLISHPNIRESISYTTRSPRIHERQGVNYHFISVKEFEDLIQQGHFLEFAKVHSNYYGTSGKIIFDLLKNNQTVLLDIDVQGADNLRKIFGKKANCIFVAPLNIHVLEERLIARNTESIETIKARVARAQIELQSANDYDYLVINDQLEVAYKELEIIIQGLLR